MSPTLSISTVPEIPTRLVNLDRARATFGHRADILAGFLHRTDPLAEAVVQAFSEMAPGKGKRVLDRALDEGIERVPSPPRALVALFEQLHETPFWVDPEQLAVGGRAMLRTGIFGLFALGAGSLPLSYATPAANKPLTFSRRLVEMAPRRILDTMRFHLHTCTPGGLAPGADGFKTTVRVRLVHAQMRRLLLASKGWNHAAWGAPINQVDQAYATVLFSAYPLGWLSKLGVHFTADERDAAIQLWRYSGHLMGVDATLLPATEAEARRFGELYELTQERPDDDARALVRALVNAAPVLGQSYFGRTDWIPGAFSTLARFFLGPQRADDLGLPASSYAALTPLLRAAVVQTEAVRRVSPRGYDFAVRAGTAIERGIVEGGLKGGDAKQGGIVEALFGAGRRNAARAEES
ncbi:MAG: DUF2236 domain-containing protein [Polyangiaceae bacterium]|nr:DUF2236 domain-containing protein [Polyangiaceae bacterium]